MSDARTYDPNRITMNFLGVPLTGFAEGSKVEAERNEASWNLKVGCDGDSCRSRSRNRSGKIKFKLMASSPSNDVLAAAAVLDEESALGSGEVGIADLNGTGFVHASKAWVTKQPPFKGEKEVSENEWEIETGDMDIFRGGSYT